MSNVPSSVVVESISSEGLWFMTAAVPLSIDINGILDQITFIYITLIPISEGRTDPKVFFLNRFSVSACQNGLRAH